MKDIFSGIVSGLDALFRVPINAIVGLINKAIAGINGLSIDIPDWVPGFGGKTFGFNIPEIPALAQGGIATAPTLAMIGEGAEKEAILPLSELDSLLQDRPADQSMTIVFSPILPYLQAIVEGMRQKQGIATGEAPAPQGDFLPVEQSQGFEVSVTPLQSILELLLKKLQDDDPPKPGGSGGPPPQFVFAPVYHIHGNANAEEMEQVAKMSFEEFKEYYERMKWEEERTTIKK